MKLYLITNNADTYEGLRMTGIDGLVVTDDANLSAAITAAADDPTVAVLLITEGLARKAQRQLLLFKTAARPLILELPDRHSAGRKSGSIAQYVKETMGIEL